MRQKASEKLGKYHTKQQPDVDQMNSVFEV